jgi:hypothetical protein
MLQNALKSFGVDLKRNFPSHWKGEGSSSLIGSTTHTRMNAADHVEVQCYIKFVQRLAERGNLLEVVDIHCCADMWLIPTGCHPCKEDVRCLYTCGTPFDLAVTEQWVKAVTDAITA